MSEAMVRYLGDGIEREAETTVEIVEALLVPDAERRKRNTEAALTKLVTNILTGIPWLGDLASSVSKALVPPAIRRLEAQTAAWRKQVADEEQASAAREQLVAEIEVLLGQGLISVVRAQNVRARQSPSGSGTAVRGDWSA